MPGKPRVSPARADAFLCSWLSHQDVELTLMAFLCSNPLEKQLFWWLSVPAVTMACLGEQPALMPIIPLALFLTESDHSSINLKIATIFVVDIINLLCVYVPSLFQALMLHHSPADPLLLWHKKTLSKTWLFHKKSTNYRLCVLCSVSSLPGWCLQSQIPRSCGLLGLEHLLNLFLGGWMWKGDVHKLPGPGVTLATKTAVMDGWVGVWVS